MAPPPRVSRKPSPQDVSLRHPGRRARRATETREKIFRAALALFAERGFQEVTVEDITEAADVGKGTFFNYFPSKEHVFAAFGDLQLGKVERALAQARSGKRGLRDLLADFPQVMAEEPGRSPLVFRGLVSAVAASEPVREIFRQRLARGREMLGELFALGQKRGEIRRGLDPAEMARMLQQEFFGAMLLWALQPTEPLARRMARAMEMIWPALEAPAKGRKG